MRKWRKPRTIEIPIKPASLPVSIEVITEDLAYKERTKCSVCGAPQEWYRLEPGTGRCVRCQN